MSIVYKGNKINKKTGQCISKKRPIQHVQKRK